MVLRGARICSPGEQCRSAGICDPLTGTAASAIPAYAPPPLVLASGKPSTFYIDCKQVTLDAESGTYITDYAKTYAVRFPRTTTSGKPVISSSSASFVLRMASALGTAHLEWKLTPTTAPAAGETRPPRSTEPLPDKDP